MFLTILRREIHHHILTLRFMLCFMLLLVFAVSTVVVRYRQADAFRESAVLQRESGDDQVAFYLEQASTTPQKLRATYPFMTHAELEEAAEKKYRDVRWRFFYEGGITRINMPMRYRFVANGVSDVLPRMLLHSFMTGTLFAYDAPLFMGGRGMVVDLLFVLTMLTSLMALLMSFDTVCGEREDGTLRLALASPLPRATLFLAKFVAGLILMGTVLLTTFACILVYLAFSISMVLTADDFVCLFAIFIAAFLYTAVFFAMGMLVSTLNERKSSALISALFAWVILLFVWPSISIIAARTLRPTPTFQKVKAEFAAIEDDFGIKLLRLRRSGLMDFTDEYQQAERRYRAEMEAEKEDLRQMYRRIQKAQVSLANNLGRASPAFSITLAVSELSDTGVTSFWNAYRNLQRFQNSFQLHWDSMRRRYGSWLQNVRPGWLKQEDIARLTTLQAPVSDRVDAALLDIALLAFGAMALFILGFTRFLRYPV